MATKFTLLRCLQEGEGVDTNLFILRIIHEFGRQALSYGPGDSAYKDNRTADLFHGNSTFKLLPPTRYFEKTGGQIL